MKENKNPRIKYWTKERVFEESKKYTSRGEFATNSPYAYKSAIRNGWIDDMTWLILKFKDISTLDNVYVYEFIEFNTVYIGRTIDPKRRHITHKTGIYSNKNDKKYKNLSAVFKFAFENDIEVPKMKILKSNISLLEGRKLEKEYIEKYKLNGWNILNKGKCGEYSGSLGKMNIKWTKEKVFEESKKYSTRKNFSKGSPYAYSIARKKHWLDEMSWLIMIKKPSNYWTKEKVFEESKKYKKRVDFFKHSTRAYYVANNNNWLDEMTWLSPKTNKEKGFWTKEKIFEEAKKYTYLNSFKKNCSGAFDAAYNNGWLNEMTWLKKKCIHNYWTKEKIFEEAKKYNKRIDFKRNASRAYHIARQNKWLDELFKK